MTDSPIADIARELAASDEPITAVGVSKKVTLRGAIANIYWKATSVLTLADRPRAPKEADDQFGHILSIRAEILVNQALLEAIIARINDPGAGLIDVTAIREAALKELS